MKGCNPIGANVTRLRHARHVSQGQLAEKLTITRPALARIESGQTLPRASTLASIAQALDTSIDELVTPVPTLTAVRFRARRRLTIRESVLAETAAWLEAYRWLEEQLGEGREFRLGRLAATSTAPDQLAAEARIALGLGATEVVRDLGGLLEDSGVKLLCLPKASDLFFGLSVGPADGGPAIVVNTWERISVERWIFTALHELGHLLMHMGSFDRERFAEDIEEEKQADRFASHFLMPEAAFAKEWTETAGLPLVDRVFKLKHSFRVSYKTVLYRLRESDRVPSDVYQVFQLQYRRKNGTTLKKFDEPEALSQGEFRFDWSRAAEIGDALSNYDFVEDRLSRLVRRALETETISLHRAAEILRRPLEDMRELAADWVA